VVTTVVIQMFLCQESRYEDVYNKSVKCSRE